MNKKIGKLLAISAAVAVTGSFGIALTACGDSETSQQLQAPVVTLNGNVVNWQAVDHATGYEVTVNSEAAVAVTQTSYTLTYTEAGEYKVTVVATSTEAGYTDSAKSNEVVYTVGGESGQTKLAAPVISLSGNVVSWAAVPNATGYKVTVNNGDAVSTAELSYTINATAAGEYKVTVVATSTDTGYADSDSSNTVTYMNTVNRFVRIESANATTDVPTKTKYYLDEKATAVDLSGLELVAVYGDGSRVPLTITQESIVGEVNLTAVGTKTVSIEYTDAGTTKYYDFEIIVKERTAADLEADGITYTTAMNEYSAIAEKYKVADTAITGAVDLKGNDVTVTTDANGSYISASVFAKSGALLIKTTDETPKFINIVAATYVSTAADFAAINNNLDGYYVLRNDIDFDVIVDPETEAVENRSVMIGKAPVSIENEDSMPILDRVVEVEDATLQQAGAAFTGTFDGNGYVLKNFKLAYPDQFAWYASGYYMGVFGYIGQDAVVKNFTLRASSLSTGKHSSFIAGVNRGTVKNVVIDDDCTLTVAYSPSTGIIAAYNDGAIENCVSYVKNFTAFGGAATEMTAAADLTVENVSVEKNIFIANTADNTEILGGGWFFVNGYGTVYGNDSYRRIFGYDKTVYVGQDVHIKVYVQDGDEPSFMTWGIAGYNADNPALKYKSYDPETHTYTFTFAEDITSETLAAGTTFAIGVNVGGKYLDTTFNVTVGAPYTTGLRSVKTENITCEKGGSINLGGVTLIAELSDGTTKEVHPTSVKESFDSSTDGEKTVTFIYTENGSSHEIEGTVVVFTPAAAVTATVKTGVDKIVVDYNNGWSLDNVDWSQYLDVNVEGYAVTATGAISGEKIALTVSKQDHASATVNVDIYLGVKDATSFAAVNENLSGWYIVTQDIDFNNTNMSPIGGIPLQQDDNGTDFSSDPSANVQGKPFVGVFDGNNKELKNYCMWEPFSIAWTQDHFGGLFGYIGESGIVKNFTLAGAKVNSVNFSSFVAGYNQGTITGITVKSDCSIFANYGAAGAFAYVNSGVITDCICYVTEFTKAAGTNDLSVVSLNYGNGLDESTVKIIAATESGSSL